MGCLFGAMLTEAGHDVWLLDRRSDRARTIDSRGVFVDCNGGNRTVPVQATADPSVIPPPDLTWIFVKSQDTARAVKSAASLLRSTRIAGTLQNGLGNVERIQKRSSLSHLVCGTTSHGATSLGWGRVRHAGTGPTVVAPAAPDASRIADEVSEVLTEAGIATTVHSDLQSVLWSKLVVSAVINPLTAVFGVNNGQLTEKKDLRDMMLAATREAAAVAAASGIALSYADPVEELERICRCTHKNISSMLQDIRHGRPTEIEQITGAIVKEARKAGVDVPTHAMLLKKVRKLGKDAA